MKIGFVWHVPYPPDGRLEKVMKAVTEHGHRAILVCRGRATLAAREYSNGAGFMNLVGAASKP